MLANVAKLVGIGLKKLNAVLIATIYVSMETVSSVVAQYLKMKCLMTKLSVEFVLTMHFTSVM